MNPSPAPSADLVREVAHGLRQPLSVIESAAYVARMIVAEGEERVIEQLERIQSMVHQMNDVLCDLVVHQLACASTARQPLNRVVSDALFEAGEQGVPLEYAEPEGALSASIAAHQAAHLVRSALAAMAHLRTGPVAVRLTTHAGEVLLEYETETSERAWKRPQDLLLPFPSVMPTNLGLALATVKRIAEANGGAARLEACEPHRLKLVVSLPSC